MLITYPYRNNLSTYAAGFADRQSRQGPEIPAAVPTGGGGQALSKSRMQFKNTSDTTLQTDTNQHNAGGELHAKLIGGGRARPRCRWAQAGPGRASRSTTPSRRLACGDLAGGPPPTGTHSGPAQQNRPRGGRKSVGAAGHAAGRRPPAHTAARPNKHNEAARPHRGRAAHASGR